MKVVSLNAYPLIGLPDNPEGDEYEENRIASYKNIGVIAFVASMCVIMPKLIEKSSDYLYSRKHSPAKPQDEEDWGPEIVKKNTLEDTEDGEI